MQCPHCQEELSNLIRYDYSQEIEQLKKEKQTLATTLFLKESELADLQAELRALNLVLSEEGISWDAIQFKQQLDLVKKKLTEWTQLINHD